jgi:DNA-binding response OmpR family regulator
MTTAVADSMTALLAMEGHDVRTAANGEAALELARGFRPRLDPRVASSLVNHL